MPRSLLPRLLFVLALVFAVRPLAAAETAPTLLQASDLLKLKSIESPALSPDGRLVVYVLRSIEPKPGAKDDWTYTTHLWLAPADGSAAPRQLTRGNAGNGSPVWHPDGRQIAFVRSVEKEKPQVYVLSLDGGEARQVTKIATGATSPRWSPDGTKLLVASSLTLAQVRDALEKAGADAKPAWDDERPGRKANDTANWKLKPPGKEGDDDKSAPKAAANPDGTLAERREWLARNEADGNPRVTARLNFLAEGDLQPDLSFVQLYVQDYRDGATAKPVALGYGSRAAAEWLADGRSVVYSAPRSAAEHPDRERLRSLAVTEITSGATRVLLDRADENYSSPTPSPDGKWIAYAVQTGGPFTFDAVNLAIIPVAGGEPKVLTGSLDRAVQNLRWSADSQAIYFTAASRGAFPLYRVTIAGGAVETLTARADWGVRAFDVAADRLIQVVTVPENPGELLTGDLAAKTTRALTTHNADWLKGKALSAYEAHSLTGKDGLEIQYWIMKPTQFDAAKKYPLLVQIHGGPSAMWGPGEDTMWFEFQYYAARGYGIVFSNPRGSGGYGRDFQRANYRDWGVGPASDVLQAATFAAREPWVDADRQVLTGGSYGGYLTAWIVGHDHRFKAAVAQRGVYDLTTFFGEGNAWSLVPLYWGGYAWEPEILPLLERDSPINYVADIKTPLLIQHGDVDFRTGVIQSQVLYKSLKALGRPVEYVRYPRATHEMSRSGEPKQRLDSLVRYEEFFRRYIEK